MTTAIATDSLQAVKCNDCSAINPVGVSICPNCGSENVEDTTASTKGTIYTYTVMHFVPVGPHKGRAPYIIAVIETEDGMRLSGIVETDDVDSVDIGDKVTFKEVVPDTGWFFTKD